MFKNFIRSSFMKNRSLSRLPKHQQEKIMENMKITYYKPNDPVFKKGSIIHSLIVIFEGRLKKFKSPITLASAGETWGDEFLDKNREIRIDDDIIADTDMVATEITFEDTVRVLGGTINEALQAMNQGRIFKEVPVFSKKDMEALTLKDFTYITQLTKIHYGSMHLLERRNEPCQGRYVCKIIEKRILKDNSLEAFLVNEMQVLPLLNFPFVCQYYRTFEEPNCYVNLFEFVNGMELYDVIREIGLLSSKDCQFYVGSMILMLEYLQQK